MYNMINIISLNIHTRKVFQTEIVHIRFEVLTAINIKITTFVCECVV
jgi:hypothetical protein